MAISCILKLKNKMNMKNLIKYGFIACVICFFTACEGGETTIAKTNRFNTVIYEDCEYIYDPNVGTRSLTHKGNCKNQIHNCR